MFLSFRLHVRRALAAVAAVAVLLISLPIIVSATSQNAAKTVYLTFDDGPSYVTPRLLEVLKKHNVKATFFVTGQYEEAYPILKQIRDDGHVIALHTYTHSFKDIYSSSEAFWADIDRLDELIYKETGSYAQRILRFPGGSSNTVSHRYGGSSIMVTLARECGEKGFAYCDWTIDPKDAEGGTKSASTIRDRVVRQVGEVAVPVVLMHDGPQQKTAPEAVDMIISSLLAEGGYVFDTLDHMTEVVHHTIS